MALKIHFSRKGHDLLSWRLMVNQLFGISSQDTLHDQTVAESLRMITSFKNFTRQQEENSLRIAIQGRQASPRGAARMQVESSAQILKSLNQLIRLNTQMLKLQSESLAMNNKTDKDSVHRFQKIDQDLGKGFKNLKLNAKLFRY